MSETFAYDNLLMSNYPVLSKQITVLTGQNLVRGTLIGEITKVCPSTGTAKVGNTGNGTCIAVTAGSKTQLGTYTLRCVTAGIGSATFAVYTPDGLRLYDAATGTAFSSPHINFTVSVGGIDFVVGDEFTIAITAGSGKYKAALLASVDGSQDLETALILGEDADASLGEVTSFAYITGAFNQNKMTFGTGYTASNTKASLYKHGIFLKDSAQY